MCNYVAHSTNFPQNNLTVWRFLSKIIPCYLFNNRSVNTYTLESHKSRGAICFQYDINWRVGKLHFKTMKASKSGWRPSQSTSTAHITAPHAPLLLSFKKLASTLHFTLPWSSSSYVGLGETLSQRMLLDGERLISWSFPFSVHGCMSLWNTLHIS